MNWLDGIAASEIAGRLSERIEALCRELLPNGKRVGAEWWCGSVNGEAGQSLGVHLVGEKAGTWADLAGDDRGDALDLVKKVLRLDTRDAIGWAKPWLGIDDGQVGWQPPSRAKVNGAATPPPITSAPPERHPKLGEPSLRHEYTDADGRLLLIHCRFDQSKGKKEFRPLSWRDGQWRWKDPPGPLPLFGLADLAAHPQKPVLLVEGEKTAEVARELIDSHVITTWPHGSKVVGKVDWTPLQGRDVVCWPDNDAPGREGMTAAAARAGSAGATHVRIVNLPEGLPDTWDLGDPLPEGWDEETVRDLISKAEEIQAPPLDMQPLYLSFRCLTP